MPAAHRPQYIEFVAHLRQARRSKGLTQGQLGTLLKKPQSFVSKVETCERRLDLLEAVEWCIALGVRLNDLLPASLKADLERPKDAHQSTPRERRT